MIYLHIELLFLKVVHKLGTYKTKLGEAFHTFPNSDLSEVAFLVQTYYASLHQSQDKHFPKIYIPWGSHGDGKNWKRKMVVA